jgi:hypothetical protein
MAKRNAGQMFEKVFAASGDRSSDHSPVLKHVVTEI